MYKRQAQVDVYDPWADPTSAEKEYQISLQPELINNQYDAIILAVSHQEFSELGVERIRMLGKKEHVLYDIKSVLPKEEVDGRL